VLVLALAALYWPTLVSLWQRWEPDPSYSHGWLIFAIAGWLVWREAQPGRLDGGRPHWLGVAALPLLGAAWLVAMAGSIGLVQWLLRAGVAVRGGLRAVRLDGAAQAVVPDRPSRCSPFRSGTGWRRSAGDHRQGGRHHVDGASHVPAMLDGNRVLLPAGSFEIVEGCSGMHYFVVSGTLAVLYGWLWYRRLGLTLGLLAVSLAVAMVANWLRVFLVIYAGYLTDMQHFLVQVDHYYFGWVLYMLMIAPVFVLARRFEPEQASGPTAHPQRGRGGGTACGTRIVRLKGNPPASSSLAPARRRRVRGAGHRAGRLVDAYLDATAVGARGLAARPVGLGIARHGAAGLDAALSRPGGPVEWRVLARRAGRGRLDCLVRPAGKAARWRTRRTGWHRVATGVCR
jgi:exosortase/archaeosortase family protein